MRCLSWQEPSWWHGDASGQPGQQLPFKAQRVTGTAGTTRRPPLPPQQRRGRRERAAGRGLTFTPSFFLLPPLLPPGERRKEVRRARQGTKTRRPRISSMVPGGRAARPRGTGWWVLSSLRQLPVPTPGAQGRPCRHRPVLPQQLSARGMTRLLKSRRVLGATQRGPEGLSGSRQRSGRWVLATEDGAARWNGLPACRPLILAPCCRDHVLPARRPDSCSPHFDDDEKQTPSPVPTYCCRYCPSPPGLLKPPRNPLHPQTRVGLMGLRPTRDPITHQPRHAPGAEGDRRAPGLCVGWAELREMLLNFLPFDASCPPRLPARGLTPDPPSCWTPPAAPHAAHKC